MRNSRLTWDKVGRHGVTFNGCKNRITLPLTADRQLHNYSYTQQAVDEGEDEEREEKYSTSNIPAFKAFLE